MEKGDFPWMRELKNQTNKLILLIDDTKEFRSVIESTVRTTRDLLKLPTPEKGVQFRFLAEISTGASKESS